MYLAFGQISRFVLAVEKQIIGTLFQRMFCKNRSQAVIFFFFENSF